MKKTLLLFLSLCLAGWVSARQADVQTRDTLQKKQVVEASCGQCQFGLKAPGCSLAIRIDGKAYFVDGADINDHGDAHAEDGFCNAVRKAEVSGKVVKGRFKASYFRLLPAAPKMPAP